jgi:hypothetical protein
MMDEIENAMMNVDKNIALMLKIKSVSGEMKS